MKNHDAKLSEETFDPEDWQSLRNLGHRMIDDLMDYHENIRQRPVWQPIPDTVKHFLDQPIPKKSQSEDAVYREFCDHILPHPMGNIHPRFWCWVIGTGTPLGMLAEMLAAGMNPNLGGGNHVAQADYLARRVDDHPELERMAPTPLNITCFRYTHSGLDGPALNALNQELLIRLHESGMATPSYTTLEGQYVLRAAITNHRSRQEDFDILVREVVRLGRDLVKK